MRKTASQIAEAVFKKLATSRWREAIRSGELAPREAETLKTRMGVDPQREARGLSKGWLGKANYHGFVPMTQKNVDAPIKLTEGSLPIDAKRRKAVMRPLYRYERVGPHAYLGRSPTTRYSFVPHSSGEYIERVSRGGGRLGSVGEKTRAELTGLIAGHEGSEIVEGMKGLKKGRINLHRPQTVHWKGTGHFSPRVVLEEIRNARMLSPQTRGLMRQVRRPLELPEIALQVPRMKRTSQLFLPKHKLEHYSKRIQNAPTIDQMMWDSSYGSKATRAKWLDKLIRQVRRIK